MSYFEPAFPCFVASAFAKMVRWVDFFLPAPLFRTLMPPEKKAASQPKASKYIARLGGGLQEAQPSLIRGLPVWVEQRTPC